MQTIAGKKDAEEVSATLEYLFSEYYRRANYENGIAEACATNEAISFVSYGVKPNLSMLIDAIHRIRHDSVYIDRTSEWGKFFRELYGEGNVSWPDTFKWNSATESRHSVAGIGAPHFILWYATNQGEASVAEIERFILEAKKWIIKYPYLRSPYYKYSELYNKTLFHWFGSADKIPESFKR